MVAQQVFPAIRQHVAGSSCDHPDLEDGWRAQLFTDAAALSSRRGGWVELAEVESESREASFLWGTFDQVRDHLYRQHQDVPYLQETGLSLPELERAVERCLREKG